MELNSLMVAVAHSDQRLALAAHTHKLMNISLYLQFLSFFHSIVVESFFQSNSLSDALGGTAFYALSGTMQLNLFYNFWFSLFLTLICKDFEHGQQCPCDSCLDESKCCCGLVSNCE